MKKCLPTIILGAALLVGPSFTTGQTLPLPSGIDSVLAEMEKNLAETDETTPLDEYYLGRAVAANILSLYQPYTGNPELTYYLNLICHALVINSAQPDVYNGYHVLILDSPEFNAFATPGGHIFLSRALVEAASSEDALAAVLAHELAHIMLKHGVSLIQDMKVIDEMNKIAEKAAVSDPSSFRNSVSAIMDVMVKNGYSRDQEFEADKRAAQLLTGAGYDPGGLQEILRILQNIQGRQSGGFNSTHPSPAERIARVGTYYRTRDTRPFREKRFINK